MSEFNEKEDQLKAPDIAKHFGEPIPIEKKDPLENIELMTKEEIENVEKAQEDSSEIYRIAARVKNQARSEGGSLTPVGESMCNLYIHVMKAFYDFADTLDPVKKEELKAIIRLHESMPGKLLNLTRKR